MIPKAEYEEGIKLCERNARISIDECTTLLKQGHFRQAFFFGVLTMEEIGKAGFIFDKWDDPHIFKNEWKNKETFFHHLNKILKGKDMLYKDLEKDIRQRFPNDVNIVIGVLGHSDKELRDIWDYRNKILFVNRNFTEGRWEGPQELEDVEKRARDVHDKAIGYLIALTELMQNYEIETDLKEIDTSKP